MDRRRRLVRREMKTIVVKCLMRDESVVSYEICLYLHSRISAVFSEFDFERQHPQKTNFMTRNAPCGLVKLGNCYSFESQLK